MALRRRGRGKAPTTKPGLRVAVHLQPDQLAALDAWIAKLPKPVSRPQAIRAILAAGLSVLDGED